MLFLVSGGAGSGKSEYAENLLLAHSTGPRIYLATMEAWGEEGQARVARHRGLRRGKGFVTLEQPRELYRAAIPLGSSVLLECLSNLCANECFGPRGFDCALERMEAGIEHVLHRAENLVIVTNELFSDGISYQLETEEYLKILAQLNRHLAQKADFVYEVVCGIPICWKGEKA